VCIAVFTPGSVGAASLKPAAALKKSCTRRKEKHCRQTKEEKIMSKPISSGDPQALEKLTGKLNACRKAQEHMKAVNAYFRKHGTCQGFPDMPEAAAAKLDMRVQNAYSWDKQPFPAYELSNNNAEIKRLQTRIEEISHNREVGFVGWRFDGGEAIINTELNRLQLMFDERPTREQCSVLSHKGFHWSPTEGAWQRQLNDNAIYALNYVDFVKPLDGKRPTELQPKAPTKDTGAR
jgi:hypothetical protein